MMNKTERTDVGRLQHLIGFAMMHHGNDRDPNGFEKGQKALSEAFTICVDMLSKYPPTPPSGDATDSEDADVIKRTLSAISRPRGESLEEAFDLKNSSREPKG